MIPSPSKQTEGSRKRRTRTKGWTPERRRAQRARIRRQQPWRFSTGPRSVLGKTRVRFNALKHGNRRFVWRELRHVLAEHRRVLRELGQWMRMRERYLRRHRTIPVIHKSGQQMTGNGDSTSIGFKT